MVWFSETLMIQVPYQIKALKIHKNIIIVESLFTAKCATVSVLHTNHPRHGDNGKYFFLDEKDFNNMVGKKDWKDNTFEVIQRGSKSWTGTIKVWNSSNQYGFHGRRDTGETGIKNAETGEWAQGDTIQLKACAEAGIFCSYFC